MDTEPEGSIKNFSLNLPKGPGQGKIPALLRHLAEELEKMGDLYVQDIVLHPEMDDDGNDWPHFSVYYDHDDTN